MGKLDGKTAVVTGGASGFGAGIARKFAQDGARVLVADLNIDGAETIAAEIGGVAMQMNVATGADWTAALDKVCAAWGGLDILVNNAGITHLPALMEDVTEEDFDRVLNVNAKSVYLAARVVVPHMKARASGAILNVASTAGVSPRPKLNWYNASKGWMITATKAMAVELAPFGVRVNCLNPVAGETPLLASFMGEDTPEIRAKFLSTIPLGRFSQPADLGNAAAFLCSDEASMITGVGLEVDGGAVHLMWRMLLGMLFGLNIPKEPETPIAPPDGMTRLHVFNGKMAKDVAQAYCFDAPSEARPEPLTRDLPEAYVDTDFVEVRHGLNAEIALDGLGLAPAYITRFEAAAHGEAWVVIMEDAFGGFPYRLHDTPVLTYLGSALVDWRQG